MRLVALTYGTEGDTRPIAALCRALMDTGYGVTLLADGGTLGSARDLGVPQAAFAGDIRGTLQSVSSTSSVVPGNNSLNATAQALARIANENADAWMRQVRHWEAPRSLESFLAAGDAPIYVGFGSMVGFDPHALLDAVIAAVDGQRALFYPGWSGADSLKLPTNFCIIGDTPHDWLFPRTSLVIHHGGSGTTHSATRSGRPSVVLPFAADQFFWAEQLRQRGIAPAAGSVHNVTVATLSRAILAARTAEMREQASAVGEKMRAENGLAAAVGRVHALMAS